MPSWFGHHVLDPMEIQSRFSLEDSMASIGSIFSQPSEEAEKQLQKVREIMEFIPPREADIIDLYYFKKMNQTNIAKLFGVSQPTIHYRLQRAALRIQFLLSIPDVDRVRMREDLATVLEDVLDVDIMMLMDETTCQSEVAKKVGVTQGFVRHRFLRSIEKVREHQEMEEYVELFDAISNNPNILREVRRSSEDGDFVYIVRL